MTRKSNNLLFFGILSFVVLVIFATVLVTTGKKLDFSNTVLILLACFPIWGSALVILGNEFVHGISFRKFIMKHYKALSWVALSLGIFALLLQFFKTLYEASPEVRDMILALSILMPVCAIGFVMAAVLLIDILRGNKRSVVIGWNLLSKHKWMALLILVLGLVCLVSAFYIVLILNW